MKQAVPAIRIQRRARQRGDPPSSETASEIAIAIPRLRLR